MTTFRKQLEIIRDLADGALGKDLERDATRRLILLGLEEECETLAEIDFEAWLAEHPEELNDADRG